MIKNEDQIQCQKLTQWIKDRGATLNKIELRVLHPGHRGIVASAPIDKNEEIIFVPETAIITLKIAKESKIGRKLQEPKLMLEHKEHCILAAYLLQEMKDPESVWKVYLDTLPKTMTSFPEFFSEEERNLLTGSIFLNIIREIEEGMDKDYGEISRHYPEEFSFASKKEFIEARIIVSSRAFGVTINDVKEDILVPYADMFNNESEYSVTHWSYCEKRKGMAVKVKQNIKEQQEILISYGDRANWELLLCYGFVLEKNENDILIVPIEYLLPKKIEGFKDKLLDQRHKTLKILLRKTIETNKFSEAMSLLRFVAFTGTEKELAEVISLISGR